MPTYRKTPVPMTVEELGILDALEDQLLDWIDARKGPFVVIKADMPNVTDAVWSELSRCARNAGWTVVATRTMIVVEAPEPDGAE